MLPLCPEIVHTQPGDVVVVTACPDAPHDHVVAFCESIRAELPAGVILVSLPFGATLQSLRDDSLAQLGLRRVDASTSPATQ